MSIFQWITLCEIAVGLAIDAFSVSIVLESVFKELYIMLSNRKLLFVCPS